MDWCIFTFQISKNQHYENWFKNLKKTLIPYTRVYIFFKIKE